jgi:hypothetical protein
MTDITQMKTLRYKRPLIAAKDDKTRLRIITL